MTTSQLTATSSETYARVSNLPLRIDSHRLEGLSKRWSPELVRRSTVVWLEGGGHSGAGEDVTYTPEDHGLFHRVGPVLPLAGRFTLASFSERLDELDLFPSPPRRRDSRDHRRWAFESAALDLALRQAGVSLAEALGREPAPVRFVVSMRLPDPPSIDPVQRRLDLYPDLRFKLDATRAWHDGLVAALAATGAIESVDFKGHYEGLPVDGAADPDLYRRVAEGLPSAWLEDPAMTDETEPVLALHAERITWDAPIRSAADIATFALRPRMVNVKPSRFGTVRALLDTYDFLRAEGIGAYGGGQFELGPGRGQIQQLAALFHPDAPNDVAPLGHHEVRAGLPRSPLPVLTDPIGFRWTSPVNEPTIACCGPRVQETCCEASEKRSCCGEVSSVGACGCR
jgi:L-alanine-DL-glutamate epimerase-like enolase superfamily enzyme